MSFIPGASGDARRRGAAARAIMTGLVAAALMIGVLSSALALDVGPKSLPLTIGGVPVEIPVSGSLDVHSNAAELAIEASASGDLRQIQDRALDIARGLRLPRDNCAHKGFNIVVDSIDEAAITPAGASVVVDLTGRATVWLCKTILGARLKTKIASDGVSISAPVELFLPNPQTVALRLSGPASIKTSDPLTEEAASAFVGDVNAALTAQLGKLLDATRARAIVPAMPGIEVTLEDAAFVGRGTNLSVRAHGRARLTSEAFASLMGFLAR
jgi:hypothetical protein